MLLLPGPRHPYAPWSLATCADHYDVDLATVEAWIANGLAVDAAGRVDPFAVSTFVSWHRLHEAPALARRWRAYLGWFRPHLNRTDRPRRLRWLRAHRLHLPEKGVAGYRWWLPRPLDQPGLQEVIAQTPLGTAEGGAWRIDHQARVEGRVELALWPWRAIGPGHAIARHIVGLLEPLVRAARYGYRHHRPHHLLAEAHAHRPEGTCLDIVALAQEILENDGLPSRIVGGLVAHEAIANPHFWLEVDTRIGPIPLDPSLACIAHMLGEDPLPWLRAYGGAIDARRIWLTRGPSPIAAVPGGGAFSLCCGEAVATLKDGSTRNAWPCLDWVCGDCRAGFETLV